MPSPPVVESPTAPGAEEGSVRFAIGSIMVTIFVNADVDVDLDVDLDLDVDVDVDATVVVTLCY